MRRRRPDLSSFFTFGGRVPATVGLMLATVLVASIGAALNHGMRAEAALMPVAIWRGEVWRLFTWAIVQPDPLTLIFAGYMTWWLGQQLSYAWSERRFALRSLGFVLAGGAVPTLLAVVWPPATGVAHLGMWPLVGALLVSWALLHPDATLNIWGVLPITGRNMALLWTGGALLYGVFSGFGAFLPHLSALALAWMQSRGIGVGGGRQWRQAKRWWADREQRRRTRHLKVVKKNGSARKSDWMN